MTGFVLAVDIGTSSLKASLIDFPGTVRASARCRFPREKRESAHWIDAYREAVAIILEHSGLKKAPDAICVSGNGPTLVSVGRAGKPGSVLLWNDPVPKPATGAASAGGDSVSLFIPRLEAYETLFADQWNESAFMLSGPEFLIWELTGNAVTILPEPRFADAYWTAGDLSRAGLDPARLPPFVAPGTIVGASKRLTGSSGRELLGAGIPVVAGGPDFIVALIGTNTLSPGTACDRAGTSEGLNVCTSSPVANERVRTLPSVMAGLWNAAYLLPETGAKFNAWRRESGQAAKAYPDIMAEIEAGSNDGGRALVEEIGKEVKKGIDLLRETTGYSPTFALSGGQARNEIWNRMKADMTGATFALTATSDGELMGDAILGFAALGAYSSVAEAASTMVRVVKVYESDPARHAHYREKFGES